MKLEDAIMTMPQTGNCQIDIEKVIQCFDKNCLISRWHDEYRLHAESTLKVMISKENALQLIDKLSLHEIKSEVFKNASTFRLEDDNQRER